ncbi:MAG TPA: ATP-dependent DNA helicase RecG, partial [Polyangia bacterium]|nr:ATP-dependent DNA helicase RecG [Polyangia bacterium]
MTLERPLLGLPGAGPVTARRLAAEGLVTVRDLLLRLPRGLDDLRRETPICALGEIPDGEAVLVRGVVRKVHVFPRRFLDVVLGSGDATVRARWFRPPPGMSKAFTKGSEVALAGPLRTVDGGARELLHPTNVTAALAGKAGLGLRPRYGAVEGVGARVYEKIVTGALAALVEDADELLPAEACARLGLPTLRAALAAVHAPPDEIDDDALAALAAGRAPAHRRVALEALLSVQTMFLQRRARVAAEGAPTPIDASATADVLARVGAALGFALTAAQARAVDEIARD